jgi:hypothetical protein
MLSLVMRIDTLRDRRQALADLLKQVEQLLLTLCVHDECISLWLCHEGLTGAKSRSHAIRRRYSTHGCGLTCSCADAYARSSQIGGV